MAEATLPKLIALNEYSLTGSVEAFERAATALAARVRTEGEPGVLAYLFFADPAQGAGRAVVHYRNAAAWVGHHDLSFGWPEMKALHQAARLRQVSLLGEVTTEMRDWLLRAGLTVPLQVFPEWSGGFLRAD